MPNLKIKNELDFDLKTDRIVPLPGGGLLKLLDALKALHIASPMKRVRVTRNPTVPTTLVLNCDVFDNRNWQATLRFVTEPMTFSVVSADWWTIAESDAIARLSYVTIAINSDFGIESLDVKW